MRSLNRIYDAIRNTENIENTENTEELLIKGIEEGLEERDVYLLHLFAIIDKFDVEIIDKRFEKELLKSLKKAGFNNILLGLLSLNYPGYIEDAETRADLAEYLFFHIKEDDYDQLLNFLFIIITDRRLRLKYAKKIYNNIRPLLISDDEHTERNQQIQDCFYCCVLTFIIDGNEEFIRTVFDDKKNYNNIMEFISDPDQVLHVFSSRISNRYYNWHEDFTKITEFVLNNNKINQGIKKLYLYTFMFENPEKENLNRTELNQQIDKILSFNQHQRENSQDKNNPCFLKDESSHLVVLWLITHENGIDEIIDHYNHDYFMWLIKDTFAKDSPYTIYEHIRSLGSFQKRDEKTKIDILDKIINILNWNMNIIITKINNVNNQVKYWLEYGDNKSKSTTGKNEIISLLNASKVYNYLLLLYDRFLKYFIKENEKEKANIKIEEETNRKKAIQDLVQQYTHTLSNTLFPNTIYNVAKTLKGSKKYRKEVLILEDAYQSEMMIKKQGQMLQLKQTGNADVFQRIIRSDRLFTDTKEENIEINEIVNQSADRVISRFLNQDTHRLNDLREHITKVKKVDIDAWKKEYENDVFFDEKITALEWTKSRLGGIKISANKTWEDIRVKRDGYSHALLQSYFMELFFNALKYRDYSKKEWAKIQLDECEKNGTEYLQMTVSNPAEKGDAKSIGMGKGLNGFKADLALLNSNDNNGEFLFIEKTKTQFSIRALLQKNLFVIKRKKRDYSKAKVALKNSK